MLPAGVTLRPLTPHVDTRGVFTELHRASWPDAPPLAQWNAVRSEAGVLRGMHVHCVHTDYLTVVAGSALVGLSDVRPDSPTYGVTETLSLTAEEPAAIVIPPGVAHGFCFTAEAVHVYAMSVEWDPLSDLGCRYDDPELGIAWPVLRPVLSPRDQSLGSLRELRDAWRAAGTAAAV